MSEVLNKTARIDNIIIVVRQPAQSERPDAPGTQQGVELAGKSCRSVYARHTPLVFIDFYVWRRSPVFIPSHKMLSRRVPPERHAPQDPRARKDLALVSGSELLRRALRDAMSQRTAIAKAAKVCHHRQRAAVESVNCSCRRLGLPLRAPSSICPTAAAAAGHSYSASGSAVASCAPPQAQGTRTKWNQNESKRPLPSSKNRRHHSLHHKQTTPRRTARRRRRRPAP